jgi:hypothetical protein
MTITKFYLSLKQGNTKMSNYSINSNSSPDPNPDYDSYLIQYCIHADGYTHTTIGYIKSIIQKLHARGIINIQTCTISPEAKDNLNGVDLSQIKDNLLCYLKPTATELGGTLILRNNPSIMLALKANIGQAELLLLAGIESILATFKHHQPEWLVAFIPELNLIEMMVAQPGVAIETIVKLNPELVIEQSDDFDKLHYNYLMAILQYLTPHAQIMNKPGLMVSMS